MRIPLLMFGVLVVSVSSAWSDTPADWDKLAKETDSTCQTASSMTGGKAADGLSDKECSGAKAVTRNPGTKEACWWYKDHYYLPDNNKDRDLLYNENVKPDAPPQGWFGFTGGDADRQWLRSNSACGTESGCVDYLQKQLARLNDLLAKAQKVSSACQAARDMETGKGFLSATDHKFVDQWDNSEKANVAAEVKNISAAVGKATAEIDHVSNLPSTSWPEY